MIFGYGRCFTSEDKQVIERQIRELSFNGAEKIFFDYIHDDSNDKSQLSLLLKTVKEGDTILSIGVSRLASSTKQFCEILDTIKNKKLCLKILGSICFDCRSEKISPMTNAFLQMSGVFAELELVMVSDRV